MSAPSLPLSDAANELLRGAIKAYGWEVRTLRDAIESPNTQPPWVIEGLVLSESSTLISALPKNMKSLSLLQACMEAVAYNTVWGHFAAPNVKRALFVETEDPQWLVEARIRGLAKGLDIPPDIPGFHYVCPGPFDIVNTGRDVIPEVFKLYKPDFMVLSTLQNMIPGRNIVEQEDMAPVMKTIIEMSRKYCPNVLITHSPQDGSKRRAAGSVTIAANFVVEGHYQARGTKRNQVHVQLHSKAGAGKSEFTLELETEGADDDPSAVRRIVYTGKGEVQSRSEQASIILAVNPDIGVDELMAKTGLGKSVAYATANPYNSPARKPVSAASVKRVLYRPVAARISTSSTTSSTYDVVCGTGSRRVRKQATPVARWTFSVCDDDAERAPRGKGERFGVSIKPPNASSQPHSAQQAPSSAAAAAGAGARWYARFPALPRVASHPK